MEKNYFDKEEEDVVHDAFLMVESDEVDYDSIEDVLLGETTFTETPFDFDEQDE